MSPNGEASLVPVSLSRREADVLQAFAMGMIDKEIAAELGVSLASVRVYRKRIHQKLGTRGFVQPVLVAWKLGLLDLESIAQTALARSGRGELKTA